ncbi:MAG: M28 family peptidase [Pirellulaceae bacterium]
MSRRTLSLALPLAVLFSFQSLQLSAVRGDEATDASEKRLKETVTHLASDDLEGRGVGTRGIDKAADFLAAEFAKLGLKTDSFDGSPFQKFKITTGAELGPSESNKLVLQGPAEKAGTEPKKLDLALSKDFIPLAMGGSGKVSAPLVFVGYGITAKDLQKDFVYDDYEGVDVKGKIVVIIRKEPQQENKDSIFNGAAPSKYAPFQQKIATATERGAVAVIFVNDSIELKLRSQEAKKQLADSLDALVALQTKFKESKEPTADEFAVYAAQAEKLASTAAESAKLLSGSPDRLLPYNGAGEDGSGKRIPVYFCLRETMDGVVKAALGKDLATIEKEIDADLKPQSKELTGWSASGESNILRKEVEAKNVIAVLEGEGPLANETIVVGAHYDHLGMGGAGSLAPWTTAIHNGADDNASGTSTLVEIATRLATSGKKPRRRIVFMAFSGEERGLLGSNYYAKNPRFPLESTIAMYNLDMVGRLKDNKLAVYGTATAKHFDAMIEELSKKMGFALTKYEGGFGPSDHSSFYAKKIPVLHFFTGTHTDYHRPSDDSDKLNIEGMRRVADMVVDIVHRTDATDAKPEYVEIKKVEGIGPSEGGERSASLGTMPDYNTKVDGVLLELIMPGGAAEKAGLKAGDVLTKIGDLKIANIDDFETALRKHKPGDKVKLKAKRGAEEVELDATLGTRRRQ